MAIGENIKRMRNLKGMTQKEFGIAVGFPNGSADVRIAQYENGTRTPKEDMINTMARLFDISPLALTTPDIDTHYGLMHTFFTLEDVYGLKVGEIDGELCLTLDRSKGMTYISMLDMFNAWRREAQKLKNEEITKDEYDNWRYNYPRVEAERTKQKLDEIREERKKDL